MLGLSLGQSAVYSVISLAAKLTAGTTAGPADRHPQRLRRARAPTSTSPTSSPDIAFTLVPVALALWLLSAEPGTGRAAAPSARRLGLDGRRPVRDLGAGAAAGRR